MSEEQKPPAEPASAAPKPATPKPKPKPAPPPPMNPALAGKTTSAAAAVKKPTAKAPAKKTPDDTSPLMSRRGWLGLAWGSFTAATAGCLAATGRFMFPNVLNEPPQQFTVGFPADYGEGVDERWKDRFGVWIVRTPFDIVHEGPGFYALLVTCTHLGCTPNYLSAEAKFKLSVSRKRIQRDRRELRGAGTAPAGARSNRVGRGRSDPGGQEPEVPTRARAVA